MGRSPLTGVEPESVEPPGHDVDLLGPSDSSDSGSDSAGSPEGDAATDAAGTGERRSAAHDRQGREAADIGVDRTFSVETAAESDNDAEPADTDEDEDPDLAFIDRARADDAVEEEAEEGEDDDETPPSTPRA